MLECGVSSPCEFTIQAQNVIWAKSKVLPGYEHFNRKRAGIESILLFAFWGTVAYLAGWPGALLIVVFPFMIANVIILGYVLTNHMLRPLRPGDDTLTTLMSVNTGEHRPADIELEQGSWANRERHSDQCVVCGIVRGFQLRYWFLYSVRNHLNYTRVIFVANMCF